MRREVSRPCRGPTPRRSRRGRWSRCTAPAGARAARRGCSARPRARGGAAYDRWFTAAAVRGASTLERASYGVRAGSVPAGDRLVSSFFGGRPERVEWERASRYDPQARRWVSRSWQADPSASSQVPAFMRPPAAPGGEESPVEAVRRPEVRSGYTCPEFGMFARQLGDQVDQAPAGPGVPARCLSPADSVAIFDGDELNVEARYLPGAGTFGGGDGWPGGNWNPQAPQQGRGRVVTTPREPSGEGLGRGRRIADAPVVAAFSSGMACVERESIVLRRYLRRSWVDTSYTEYDPTCDLSGVVLPPGTPPADLQPLHCGAGGFDPAGSRTVESGYWNTWWEHVWEPNAAETDPHLPWARVFWHDGGGTSALESGGVLLGDDGTGVCLIGKGYVRSPALPAVVPPVAGRLAGTWTDYRSGTVPVECPKEDGTVRLTSAPAGSPAPAFDVLVSVDFAPLIHEEAAAESYSPAGVQVVEAVLGLAGGRRPGPGGGRGLRCRSPRVPRPQPASRFVPAAGGDVRGHRPHHRAVSRRCRLDDVARVGRAPRVGPRGRPRARYAVGRRRRCRFRRGGRGAALRRSVVPMDRLRPPGPAHGPSSGLPVGRVGGAGPLARGRGGGWVCRPAPACGGARPPRDRDVHAGRGLPAGARRAAGPPAGDRGGGAAAGRR